MSDVVRGLDDEALFDRGRAPTELATLADERGWPAGLLDRLWAAYAPVEQIEWFLGDGDDRPGLDDLARYATTLERLRFGTVRRRHAQESDNAAVRDLCAHAPEEIDGFEITVERGPDAFAQYRLQDRVDIRFVEDRGLPVAMSVVGGRNCLVGGKRTHVAYVQSYRTRRGLRGRGYSRLVTGMDFPATTAHYDGQVAYVRARNAAAVGWAKAAVPGAIEGNDMDGEIPGTEVRVEQFHATPLGEVPGVRPATRDDLPRCVELINRTHEGLDLFRPYTAEWLSDRLDQWSWAPKPDWYETVYGWGDLHVLERHGGIVACAGLWDRGRHVRERWRNPADGTERLIDATALLDFGAAADAIGALGDLVRHFVGATHRLGRGFLLAPLQQHPALRDELGDLESTPERRGLIWRGFTPCTRPDIDLVYW